MAIDEILCGVCHKPREWHDQASILHQFDPGGKLRPKTQVSEPADVSLPKGDPILRLVLIRKGVISVDELEEVEKELKASGVASANTVARSSRENSANS
jgi:hypothetical protein